MIEQEHAEHALDWTRYVNILLARKWQLALVFIIALPFGVVVAHFVPLKYTATMTVTAARYASDTKPATSGASLGSLLSSPDQGELSDFALYLKLFDSQLVAQRIYQDHPDLVHRIFASEWRGDHWAPPMGIRPVLRSIVYRMVGARPWSPPSTLELAAFLHGVDVEPDRRTPVAIVTLQMRDRALALEILTVLHDEAESVLKNEATVRSSIKADFLERMASNSRAVDVSQTVATAEIRNEIAATVSRAPVPFAAEYISPPTAPALPSQFGRVLAPLAVAVLALLIASFYFILADYFPALPFGNKPRHH